MFSKKVYTSSILMKSDLDGFFSKINVNENVGYAYDNSFLATLRILVNHRIPEGKIFSVFSGMSKIDIFEGKDIEICIAEASNPERTAKLIEGTYPRLKELPDIHNFVKNFVDVRVFKHEEASKVVLILDQKDQMKGFHLLQGLLPKYLPELFQEQPLTKEEITFLAALTKASSADYEKAVRKAEEQYDFKDYLHNLIMEKIFRQMYNKRLQKVSEEFQRAKKSMEEQFEAYKMATGRFSESLEALERAESQKDDSHKELVDYLAVRKDVTLTQCSSDSFYLSVCTPLDLFDPDIYASVKKNLANLVCSKLLAVSEESFLRFADHCFSENADTRIYVQGAYEINLSGSAYPDSCENKEWDDPGCAFNPHLEQHHCSGNYGPLVNSFCKSVDYIGAIEQITASVKSINFAETAVTVAPFFIKTYRDNRPCVELPTGERVTMTEAIRYFDKEENHEASENE